MNKTNKDDPILKIIQFKGDVAESFSELTVAIKKECGSIRMAQKAESNTIRAAAETLIRFGELLNNPSQEDLDRMILARDRQQTYMKRHKT